MIDPAYDAPFSIGARVILVLAVEQEQRGPYRTGMLGSVTGFTFAKRHACVAFDVPPEGVPFADLALEVPWEYLRRAPYGA